jgi:hypothetical protein
MFDPAPVARSGLMAILVTTTSGTALQSGVRRLPVTVSVATSPQVKKLFTHTVAAVVEF